MAVKPNIANLKIKAPKVGAPTGDYLLPIAAVVLLVVVGVVLYAKRDDAKSA